MDNSDNNNNKRPWLVFSAGSMGVGKGYVLTQLHQAGLFPMQDSLKIDPDMIKSELPQLSGYLQWSDPALAATKVHRESTQMADILLEYGLGHRLNALVDGSLRDVDHYSQLIARIRAQYGNYRIGLLHVIADPHIVYQRAQERAIKTGRTVPRTLLKESMQQVPKSVERLSPFVNVTYTIENNENQPMRLVSATTATATATTAAAGKKNLSWQDCAGVWANSDNENDSSRSNNSSSQAVHDHLGVCRMSSCWNDPRAYAAA